MAVRLLERYAELADGSITVDGVSVYDVRLLNHRIDIERVLAKFPPHVSAILLAVHRDGIRYGKALRMAGIKSDRPHRYVQALELQVGKALCEAGLSSLLEYIIKG